MKSLTAIALVLAFGSLSLPAQKQSKKNSAPPAVFNNARYVYVQAEDGDITNPRLFPEDRQAISDVLDGLREWNRYAIAITPGDADLIFVVRKGRLLSAQGSVGISRGSSIPRTPSGSRDPTSPQDPGTSLGVGSEVGPPDDVLWVYMPNGDRKRGTQIWVGRQDDGLDAPKIPLLRQLRAAVDQAYPVNPAPQKKKP